MPGTTITISGSSNDSKLVLSSQGASIADGGEAPEAVTTLKIGIGMGSESLEGQNFPKMLDEELNRLSHGKMRATLFTNPNSVPNIGPGGSGTGEVLSGLVDGALLWSNFVFRTSNIAQLAANGLASAYTGLNAVELIEYYTSEEGIEDYKVIYADSSFVGLPACQIGPEAFGWSKTEIKSLADMNDLSSIRMPGGLLNTISKTLYGDGVVSAGGGDTALGVSNETFDFWEWNGLPGDEAWLTGNSPSALARLKAGTSYPYYYPQSVHQETLIADVVMDKTRFNRLTDLEKLWLREACAIVSLRFYYQRQDGGIEIENKIRDPSNTEWSSTIQIQDTPFEIIKAFKEETVSVLDAAAATDPKLKLMLAKLTDFAKRQAYTNRVATLEAEVNNLEISMNLVETQNTNLETDIKLLQQEVVLNRGVMAPHLPIVATNNTGIFSKGGNAYKLGFNSYGEFKNYNNESVEQIRFVDHGYDKTKFTEKIIKNIKYTSTLIDVNQTASLGILSRDPSINGILFAPGHSDQVFFDDPSYNGKIVPLFNYRNEFNSMLKQEAIDNSNNMIFIFNLPNAYGRDLDAHYPTKCSTYNLYDLSGTTVLDTSLNLSGDVSNGPIVHSFYDLYSTPTIIKSVCTKIKSIKTAHPTKNSTIYLRGFDFYGVNMLTVVLSEFSNNEIVLGYYNIPPTDTLLDLSGIRVISPYYLDTNTEFYEYTQFYDTAYTKCNDDYNFINGVFTNMLINKIYDDAGEGNDASFAAVSAAARNLNLTNADLSAAGFGNALYADISGSELGDNLWVLTYNSSNHLEK